MTQTRQPRPCGCPELGSALALSRRRFLAGVAAGTGALTATTMFGDSFRQVSYGATRGGNVLVVLSLRGGSDGLSMVVPRSSTDHDRLRQLRPGIAVPKASLLGADPDFGLHPEFAPLLPMWENGTFGAVHAVGLPAPNRSHFDAMAAIEDADPGTSARVGWINRTIGLDATAQPETAVQLGSTLLPTVAGRPRARDRGARGARPESDHPRQRHGGPAGVPGGDVGARGRAARDEHAQHPGHGRAAGTTGGVGGRRCPGRFLGALRGLPGRPACARCWRTRPPSSAPMSAPAS